MTTLSDVVLNGAIKEVTRLEIVDHTACNTCIGTGFVSILEQTHECPTCHGLGLAGRSVEYFDDNKQIELSVQDDGRTLKIFINKREGM